MAASQAKSGGNRKIGRDLEKCALYRIRQIRYKNKVRKARKRYGRLPELKLDRILAAIRL